MTSTHYVNGASPAAGLGILERMAANGNDQIFLNQLATISTEIAGLRADVAMLSRQVTKIEALDTHKEVEDLVKRVQTLENDKARYEGRAETWKYIVTGLTILTGIMSAVSMFIAFKK